MKPKGLDYIRETVNQEGFDYAFTGYSNFEEIKDKEFHRLREAYLKARKELAEYIGVE
jgi:hypothetical protein